MLILVVMPQCLLKWSESLCKYIFIRVHKVILDYVRYYYCTVFYDPIQAKISSYILAVSIPSNLCYSRWRNSRRKCHIWIYYWSWSLSSWYYFKSTTKFDWGRGFFIRLILFQPTIEITTIKKIFSGNGKPWCSS